MTSVVKSYSYALHDSNKCKLDCLISKAKLIRDFKNEISEIINADLSKFSKMSKFDCIKFFCKGKTLTNVSGQDLQHAAVDVFTAYENRMEAFKNKMQFKIQSEINRTFYKKSGKTFNSGDLKTFELKFESNKLSKVMSFLARYWNETTLTYINNQLNTEIEQSQRVFYQDVVHYINKFGESRLSSLALLKRENVMDRMKIPIKFSSLSFRSLNQISVPIIDWNKNKDVKFNAFITLGAINGRKAIQFPTKHSNSYHGNIKDYQKGKNTEYTIVFVGNKPSRIVLTANRDEFKITGKTNYVGVDVNVKHNLFSINDGSIIDYDRDMFNDYVKFLKHLDEKKNRKNNSILSKRDARFYSKRQVKIKNMLKRKCSELVDKIKALGKDHLVIEDLGSFGKSFTRNDEFDGLKYSRLVRLLNLSDIKNILSSICQKKDIQLSIVQPHYTSQTCPICGHISKENRQSQEQFKCVECGHEDNADHNSAINIFNRLSIDVLRTSLLKEVDGTYIPRMLKKEMIKTTIEKFYNYE